MAFENDFRPDIIAGNPPYNNGMDIDFVFDAFEVAKIAVAEITPAKFQTAEADQKIASKHSYGDFRSELVPHIKELVFYPNCRDIFEIFQTDGIAWYVLTHNRVDEALVVNKCIDIEYFNSKEARNITKSQSLLNICNEVIESMGNYESFEFTDITHRKRYEVWINTKVSGFDWYNNKEPRYVISISRVLDNDLGETYDGESKPIFESDSLNDCKSFLSWIYSKPVRFLLMANISKLNNIFTNHCFRFVPKETEFNHLFTDEELYTKYGINQYKEVINRLIKERNIDEMQGVKR